MKNVSDSDMTEIDFAYQPTDTSSFDTAQLIQSQSHIPRTRWGESRPESQSLPEPNNSEHRPEFLIIFRSFLQINEEDQQQPAGG